MPDMPDHAETMRKNAIVIFADAGYFPLAHVLGRSAHAAAGSVADVIVFTDDAGLVARYAGDPAMAVRLVDLSGRIPQNAAAHRRITDTTYGRLFLGDLLDERYARVLYLDCDIAVEPGFADVFALDLEGMPIAAAIDAGDILRRDGEHAIAWRQHLTDIGLAPDAPYFNAGVLLIDLDAWRRIDVAGEAFAFLAERGKRATSMDQDALNVVFGGRWARLSQRYNFQFPFMGLGLEEHVNPRIWHYTGHLKPWFDLVWPHDSVHTQRLHAQLAADGWPDFVAQHRKPEHRKLRLKKSAKAWFDRLRWSKQQRAVARLAARRGYALELLNAADRR
jgi:lipopolysaccharide biosynthesis glycosyltransferase